MSGTRPEPLSTFSIGVDIGGTFTDCAVVRDDGRVVTGKVPTTPADRSEGFFGAVADAAGKLGLGLGELLGRTSRLAHGTTTGINALVTRQGARTAVLATAGHGSAIRIMDNTGRVTGATMEEILDYASSSMPEQFVASEDIREVTERIDVDGDVVVALDEQQVRATLAELVADGVEAVAVAFLWSHVNPTHEAAVAAIARAEHPGLFVSCSHEVAPRVGEYPRTASTLMNSYVGPLMDAYVSRIEARAAEHGYTGPVLFATIEGGLVDSDTVRRLPITTMQSGPVAGVLGCAALSGRMGFPRVVTTDMGGTSLDAGVVEDGDVVASDEAVIERHSVYLRRVDVESIGAGGGSIAWFDELSGTLKVGPRSAGAVPGPVCYGRGGTEPTVTDADLVLGLLDPSKGLAGGVELDLDAAWRAVEALGRAAGLSTLDCAAGIVRLVDSRMEDLIRRVLLQNGHDPRDFSVWAFGGAAGLHAGLYSSGLGIRDLVIPVSDVASVWSAYGIALSGLARTFQAPVTLRTPLDPDELNAVYAKLEQSARDYAAQVLAPDAPVELTRRAELKYALQFYTVEVEAPAGVLGTSEVDDLLARFDTAYERRYGEGSGFAAAGVAVTTLSVTMRSPREPVLAVHDVTARPEPSVTWRRRVYWLELGDFVDTPIVHGPALVPGTVVAGPAVVDFPDTSIAVRPGRTARMDRFRNIVLDVAGPSETLTEGITV